MIGEIFGQANGFPLKVTHNINLRILHKLPANERKSATLTGLMNNLPGLDPLCDAVCMVTLEKYATYMQCKGKTILIRWHDVMAVLRRCYLLPPMEHQYR